MKKKIFVVAIALLLGANLYAQRKSTAQEEKRLFEEAISRTVEPEIRMFIQPTIADVEIIATERQQYGPYMFPIQSASALTEGELNNAKAAALYRATELENADVIVGTLFDSYISEKNSKVLVIKLSGFPGKYKNFRSITNDDVNMIKSIYPFTDKAVEGALESQSIK